MKRLIISTLMSAALFAAAIAIQRSPSTEPSAGTLLCSWLQVIPTVTDVNKATNQGLMMAAFTFICPTTSMKVQHRLDDDVPENEYEGIICAACTRLHFLDRKTGKLIGQDKE